MAKTKKDAQQFWWEIIDPTFVWRVGYPRTVTSYIAEVRDKHMADIDALVGKVTGETGSVLWVEPRKIGKCRSQIVNALAYELAKREGFGGPERTLHYVTIPSWAGKLIHNFEAVRTRVVTGTRVEGWSHYDSWTGEYDGEGPRLHDQKHHTLIRTGIFRPLNNLAGPETISTRSVELLIEPHRLRDTRQPV